MPRVSKKGKNRPDQKSDTNAFKYDVWVCISIFDETFSVSVSLRPHHVVAVVVVVVVVVVSGLVLRANDKIDVILMMHTQVQANCRRNYAPQTREKYLLLPPQDDIRRQIYG